MSELNLIPLGPAGAGKGTQAPRLRKDFDLAYIATGDLLRHHVEEETELGKEASAYMDAGKLVPDPLVIAMILGKVESEGDDGFLLDGFPRNDAQAESLIDYYEDKGLLRRFDGTRSPTEVHDHIRATLATLRLEERL